MPNQAGNSGGGDASFSIDATDLLKTSKVLKSLDDRTFLKGMRSGLRAAAKPIADKAKSNISGVSAAVAKSITVETAFTAKKSGVFISAKRNKMPKGHEALPGLLEKGSKGSSSEIRHPLFGDKEHWYSQPAHPFLKPALSGEEEKIANAIRDEILKAIKAAGLTE